jgi:hypothetical protein
MPSVYARTVREAERLVGYEQLCRALQVERAQLEKWLSGAEEPPLSVFLCTVDIVLERRNQQH